MGGEGETGSELGESLHVRMGATVVLEFLETARPSVTVVGLEESLEGICRLKRGGAVGQYTIEIYRTGCGLRDWERNRMIGGENKMLVVTASIGLPLNLELNSSLGPAAQEAALLKKKDLFTFVCPH